MVFARQQVCHGQTQLVFVTVTTDCMTAIFSDARV